jgi:pimeloyl-ACP methyl ester carboxylesterase
MDTAHDLTKLLKATQLEPPYIPMAHSYGGIVARSFLELHKENPTTISGLILCDTATELMLQVFPSIPDANLEAVARNVDWEALTHLREESGMSDAEYAYAMEAQMRTVKGLAREDTHASGRALALCEQLRLRTLGSRPLLVTRSNLAGDFQRRYDEGVRLGEGTEEEREKAREFILLTRLYQDQIARVQGLLSSEVAFRAWEEYGHDAPIRNVDFVVGEVVGWFHSSVDV